MHKLPSFSICWQVFYQCFPPQIVPLCYTRSCVSAGINHLHVRATQDILHLWLRVRVFCA